MAVIAQTNGVKDSGAPTTVARTVLSASDTLTYTQGAGQILALYNTTASLVTVTLTGSAVQTITPPGYGGTISTAGGKAIGVPASSTVFVDLDDIFAYLQGTVTVTGGTGVTAHLYV
jgi:hypothetical protein